MQDKPITLDQYAAQIVRPMVIEGIKSGRFDNVLTDPDVFIICYKDELVREEAVKRLEYIVKNPVMTAYVAGDLIFKTKLPND